MSRSKPLRGPVPLSKRPEQHLPGPSDWSFELVERTTRSSAHGPAVRPRHLPEPARGDHRRADDGRLRQRGHAGELPPLELRQGVHLHREELPARPHGPGLRDRHQLQSLHRLPDGGEHDGDAGAGDRARGLRPQQFLQGQLPVPHVDRCVSIIDYLVYAKNYVAECEERHGLDAVEEVLDSLPRADEPRRRPLPPASRKSLAQELPSARTARPTRSSRSTTCGARCHAAPSKAGEEAERRRFPEEPQENLLYFIEKNAPLLEPWQREIVRIVRKVAQYFYPQRQTQVMNEGWATFWHYTLLNTMYDDGYLTDGMMIEWLKSHTNVVYQPPVGHRALQRHQPLRAGLRDVHRHQAHLRAPDRRRPPVVPRHRRQRLAADAGPRDAQLQGRELHRPVPVAQADARVPPVRDPRRREGERAARLRPSTTKRATAACAKRCRASTTWASREPNIQVWNVNLRGDRSLTLRHTQHNDRPLHDGAHEVLKHVARLWGFGVHLESVDQGRRQPSAGRWLRRRSQPEAAMNSLSLSHSWERAGVRVIAAPPRKRPLTPTLSRPRERGRRPQDEL